MYYYGLSIYVKFDFFRSYNYYERSLIKTLNCKTLIMKSQKKKGINIKIHTYLMNFEFDVVHFNI